mmetsp:Transcript_3028/g.4854  ORF Transcript_3028/g.4854 Transcript_3028/m.4854 type:complete len:310 (-) Transcript_3028:540-1469(-)
MTAKHPKYHRHHRYNPPPPVGLCQCKYGLTLDRLRGQQRHRAEQCRLPRGKPPSPALHPSSVHLDDPVDVAHEAHGAGEANGTQHERECVADQGHVAEVEAALQHAVHVRAVVVVEERVRVDERPAGAPAEERAPPPPVILQRQLEVDQRHSDEAGDHQQQQEGQEEDPEERVDLVAPDGGENVVQLDVDGREGQKAGHEHLGGWLPVPGDVGGDLAWHLVRPAGGLQHRGGVPPNDAAQHMQRERDQQPHAHDGHDGVPGQGGRGGGRPGHRVHPAEDSQQRRGEGQGGEHDVPHPGLAVQLLVQAGA